MAAALPPMVSGGLPVVGHIFEMLRDREGLFKRGFAEHGNAFAMRLASLNVLVITGSENNKIMYTQTDKALDMQEGYGFLKEAVGGVLFTADKADYYNQRPALQEIFKRERMVGYIQAMNTEVQRWLDSLGEHGETDITEDMRRLTQYVAGRALIGANFRDELDDTFWHNYALIGQSLDPVLPPNLPLPKFKRRDRARKEISAVLEKLIDRRRQNPGQYDDLISALLTTPLKDGTIMSDETIVSMFMALIFAGHETTAGQAAWLIARLLQNPDYLDEVREEISDYVHYGQPVDAGVLSQLEKIYWAIDETTRMHPSADTQIRTVQEPVTIGDYVIPAGWRMMVSGATSHFLPDEFENPEQFDPARFSPERGEGKDPFAIIGFGGGIHKCTGMNFAKNEMAIITSLFFKQFTVELLSDEIHTVSGSGANRPSTVRVRYQRKPLTHLADAATIREAAAAGCPHIKQHLAAQEIEPVP